MIRHKGKTIVSGYAKGPALFTDIAVNFTAAFTKPIHLLPGKKSFFWDDHHPWFKEDIRGKVLFFPACIGSTHTGLVILDLVRLEYGPAALVVESADPLLVSGILISDVWYGKKIPLIELPMAGLTVARGQTAEVIGETGEVLVA